MKKNRWPSLVLLIGGQIAACGKHEPVPLPELNLDGMEEQVAAKIQVTRDGVLASPGDTSKLSELAITLHAHGLEAQAMVLYERLSTLDPNDYRWPYLHGVLAAGIDLELAQTLFLKAQALSPTNSGFHARLGDLYYKQAEHAEAQASYQRAIELDPGQAYALLGLASIVMDENKPQQALEYLDQALHIAPHFGQAHRLSARAYHRLGQNERAQQAAEQAEKFWLRTKPNDPVLAAVEARSVNADAYTLRGIREMNRSDFSAAKRQFSKAVEYDPTVETRLNLADALQKLGDHEGALAQQTLALEQAPDHLQANLQVGLLYQSLGEPKVAIKHLEIALVSDPANAKVVTALADTLIKNGDHTRAITLLNDKQALGSNRLTAMLAWELATAPKPGQRDGRRALSLAQGLLDATPTDPVLMDLVAVAHAELGDFEAAAAMGQAALETANGRGRDSLKPILRRRLALYADGQPFHATN